MILSILYRVALFLATCVAVGWFVDTVMRTAFGVPMVWQ